MNTLAGNLRLVLRGLLLICTTALICHVSFAGSRAYITSCCTGGTTLSFLDNATNEEVGFLPGQSPISIAFSPDGGTAYILEAYLTTVWVVAVDVTTRAVISSAPVDDDPLAIAVSPDGNTGYLAEDAAVAVISLPKVKVLTRIHVEGDQCTDVKISPDGSTVYAACFLDQTPGGAFFNIIDTSTNKLIAALPTSGNGSSSRLAVSPDGTRAYMTVSGPSLNGYVVVDLTANRILNTVFLPSESFGLALNPSGAVLYSSGAGVVYAVTPATGRVLQSINVSSGQAGLAVTPDGKRLYAANHADGTVAVIDLANGRVIGNTPVGALPMPVAISPDGNTTLVGNVGSTLVYMVDTATDQPNNAFEAGTGPAGVAFSPDGRWAYVLDKGAYSPTQVGSGVMILDALNFKRIVQIPIAGASTMAVSPDSSTVYCGANAPAGSKNIAIYAIDAQLHAVKATIELGSVTPEFPPTLAIPPDGKELYAAYNDSNGEPTLAVIDTSNNVVTQNIALSSNSNAAPFVALSSDGTRAYVTVATGLAIVDTVHQQLLETVPVVDYMTSLAISPGGNIAYIVSTFDQGFDNVVVIFDLTTYQVLEEIPAADVAPFFVAFTTDGAKAYVTAESGPVLIIDTASGKPAGGIPIFNSLDITIADH
jgi:YVTN family beta-propeller protein